MAIITADRARMLSYNSNAAIEDRIDKISKAIELKARQKETFYTEEFTHNELESTIDKIKDRFEKAGFEVIKNEFYKAAGVKKLSFSWADKPFFEK